MFIVPEYDKQQGPFREYVQSSCASCVCTVCDALMHCNAEEKQAGGNIITLMTFLINLSPHLQEIHRSEMLDHLAFLADPLIK